MKHLFPILFALLLSKPLLAQYALPQEYLAAGENAAAITAGLGPVTQLTYLNLLLGGDQEMASQAIPHIQSELNRLYAQLGKGEVKAKQYKSKTEEIQQIVEQTYLKTYDPYAGFEQIFKRGAFNSATASALYALILDHYKIPHTIQVEPRHIFPVADPQDQNIALPVRYDLNGEEGLFQGYYFKLLKDIGLVTLEELDRHSEETIWTQYYGPKDEKVELTQLAGILHYQKALSRYKAQAYREALDHIEKAQNLYISPRHLTIRYACLYQLAELAGPNDPGRVELLVELYKLNPNNNVRSLLLKQLLTFSKQCLVDQSRPEQMQAYFQTLKGNLPLGTPIGDDIKELYLMQMAKYYARNGNSAELFAYMDSMYTFRPQNAPIKEALANMLVESLRKEKDFNNGIGQLEQYHRKYPFLASHPPIQDLELFFRGEQIRQLFNTNQETAALTALSDFERLLSKYDKAPRLVNWVTTAYAASSYYYFRFKSYTTARELIERALAYAPGDAYLEHQLDLMRAYER